MKKCFVETQESEMLDYSEIFWMIKNYYLLEIVLDNELFIRQWKDIEMWDMNYWKVYLTDWRTIYDVWKGRWEDELQEWIEKCEKKRPVWIMDKKWFKVKEFLDE